MGYSKQNSLFFQDKNQFFAALGPMMEEDNHVEQVEYLANQKEYPFLLNNQQRLEAEFVHLFAVLKKQKEENNEAFWLYCYYCACLLESFYKAYAQHSKAQEYAALRQQIKNRITGEKAEKPADESFFLHLENSIVGGLRNLFKAPFHLSQLRDYVAFSNVCRLYWVFCRLTLTNALIFAKELQFLEKLDVILGTHTDVDKIVSVFQAPNGLLNYLSVGFFLARFLIDGGLLLRHTFFPTAAEKRDNTTAFERFKYELYKRHCNFANDLVWATVNFLTNFNHISHIPGPIAGAITAAFLSFDVCMALYKCHLAKQEYLVKKAQYEQEYNAYNDLSQFTELDEGQRRQHSVILRQQLTELEIEWRSKQANFYFNAAAAAFLMLGFSSALIFTPPGVIIASFFVCTIAIAMYLSSGAYSKYEEKRLRLEQAQISELSEASLKLARKEYEAARNDFIFTMVKNTIIPTVLIATFAICWPAAVALTIVYVGYELFHSLDQHQRNKEVQQLALGAPEEEVPTQGCIC